MQIVVGAVFALWGYIALLAVWSGTESWSERIGAAFALVVVVLVLRGLDRLGAALHDRATGYRDAPVVEPLRGHAGRVGVESSVSAAGAGRRRVRVAYPSRREGVNDA